MLRVLACIIIASCLVSNAGAAALDAAAERYRSNLITDIEKSLAGARALRDCVAANNPDCAKREWIAARDGWERSEVFTGGFVPDLDQQIDAWPNALHGFHGIEAKLFGSNSTDVREESDALVAHLTDVAGKVHEIPLTPQGLLNGLARLAYEIGESKADGGESRVSGTSLNDMQSNADGIEDAYRVIFLDAIKASDEKLATDALAAIERLKAGVKANDLRNVDGAKLRSDGEELVALLQTAAPKIGLEKPTLEEPAK
jgi:iron uptake system EfeUOB component EfeO/EfeM